MRKSKFWTVLESGKKKKGNYLLWICNDLSFLSVSAFLSPVAYPSQHSLAEGVRKKKHVIYPPFLEMPEFSLPFPALAVNPYR